MKIHTWDDCPVDVLREHVLANVTGFHKTCEGNDVPQVFVDYAKSIIEDEMGYEVDHWQYWISELESLDTIKSVPPEHNREWQLKFPHTHQWDGVTLVLYLQAPEAGGELVILDPNLETELFRAKPEVGTAAVMADHAIHGVKAIKGSTNRVTMIAGAYPYAPGQPKCGCPDKHLIPKVTN